MTCFLHNQITWARSLRARRDCKTSAFGSFLPRLMPQTVQKLSRETISLKNTVPSQYPFKVCTFNVLADGLAQSGDFVKVPISCLQWEHRLPLILQEIRAADADIICLQELNHFDVLAAALVPEGYSCFFRAKQPSPALKFGFPADGIALFYRHSRFSCNPAPTGHCFASIDGQPAAQGFVTALLHDKLSGRHLLVAATHLKAKAGADNEQTRVHQANQLLCELEHMQERHMQLQLQQPVHSSSNGTGTRQAAAAAQAAVLLCGDFNTTPDSDTVQTIKSHGFGLRSIWDVPWSTDAAGGNGSMHSNNGSNGKHSSSAAAAARQPDSSSTTPDGASNGTYTTSLGSLQTEAVQSAANGGSSVADSSAAAGPAPVQPKQEFTTWKFRSSGVAKRTIDYIWYSGAQLTPTSRWRMLSEEEIGPAGLPNTCYPSDHMAVTCQFGWLDL